MRIWTHLFAKDFHRLRWDLAAFAALVVCTGVFVQRAAATGENAWAWFLAIQTLLLVTTCVQLIHIDPLVGTTAFWRTTPIPRGAMLVSKLLFACSVFVAFPSVVTAVTARASHLLWFDVLAATASAALVQALIVFPVLAVASLTSTLAAFFLSSAVVLGSLLGLNFFVGGWVSPIDGFGSLTYSRLYAAWLLLLAGTAAVVPVQAFGLRRSRTIVLGSIGPILGVFAFNGWAWDYLAAPTPLVDAKLIERSAVQLQWHPDRVSIGRRLTRGDDDSLFSGLGIGVTWSGVPPGMVVDVASVRAVFTEAGGRQWKYEEAPARPSREVSNSPVANSRYMALQHAAGGVDLERENYWTVDGGSFTVLSALDDAFARIEGRMGRLDVEFNFDVVQFNAVASAPLADGARLTYPGHSVEIRRTSVTARGADRRLEIYVNDAEVMYPGQRLPFKGETIIRHASRREALLVRPTGPTPYYELRSFEPLASHLTFHPMYLAAGVFVPERVDESWLSGAQLIRIEPVRLGRITRSLTIHDFVVRATTND